MTSMIVNNFLATVRHKMANLLSYTIVHVVLGNESCDLDSAVSALVYALLLSEEHKRDDDTAVVPVFNIPRTDLNLKTEVVYFLQAHDILLHKVPCRDEVPLEELLDMGNLALHLVDFHQLIGQDHKMVPTVQSILDHRIAVSEALAELPATTDINMKIVGSCCTLVAEEVRRRSPSLLCSSVAKLLRGTILLDTVCFSEAAGRTSPKDVEAVEFCERVERTEIFQLLVNARKDVSALSAADLLRKDFKLLQTLPVPGLPELVADYLKRKDAAEALKEMCDRYQSSAAVIIGMVVDETSKEVTRDIAIFEASKSVLGDRLRKILTEERSLRLTPVQSPLPNATLYSQGNTQATRKHILPIIRKVL